MNQFHRGACRGCTQGLWTALSTLHRWSLFLCFHQETHKVRLTQNTVPKSSGVLTGPVHYPCTTPCKVDSDCFLP